MVEIVAMRKTFLDYIDDSWITEIFFMALSSCCCVAIAAMLFEFNDKPAPVLHYGLTLNAIIAILATTSKSSLSLVVAACIGQRKWLWYQDRARRLSDLQTFDDASRGPLGAIWLLMGRTVRSVTSLGALIVILLLAFDPFLQQVAIYSSTPVYAKNAAAQVTQAFGFPFLSGEMNFSQAIQAAIWTDQHDIQPLCPSANCTWPVFTSLEWCSKCDVDQSMSASIGSCSLFPQNLTDLLSAFVGDVALNLSCSLSGPPNDYYPLHATTLPGVASCYEFVRSTGPHDYYCGSYDIGLPYESVFSSYDVVTDYYFLGDENYSPSSNFSVLGVETPYKVFSNLWFDHEAEVTRVSRSQTCVLDLCFREKKVTVTDGVLDLKIERQWESVKVITNLSSSKTTLLDIGSYDASDVLCWLPSVDTPLSNLEVLYSEGEPLYYVDKENLVFCLNPLSGRTMTPELSLVTGLWTQWQSYECDNEDGTSCHVSRNGTSGPTPLNLTTEFGGSRAFQQVTSIGLENTMDRIAMSLSKLALSSPQTTNIITGKASSLVFYVQVRWLWFVFPFSLNLSGLVFLLLTIRATKSNKVPLWKSSAIALLYHGLEDRSKLAEISTLSGMDQSSASSAVQLRSGRADEGLMLRNLKNEEDPVEDSSALLMATVASTRPASTISSPSDERISER